MKKKIFILLLSVTMTFACLAPSGLAYDSDTGDGFYAVPSAVDNENFPELDYVAQQAKKQPRAEAPLPASYDLTALSQVSSVKDQGSSNLCWAFSAAAVAESAILKSGGPEMDFSEQHMAYSLSRYTSEGERGNKEGFDRTTNGTASARKAQAYLSRYSGFVLEKDDPFVFQTVTGDGPTRPLSQTLEKPRAGYVGDYINIPNPVSRTAGQIELHRQRIKRCLMEYGAVGTAIYMNRSYYVTSTDQTTQGAGTMGNSYYDGTGSKNTSHLVTIVGWDDNYPRENFRSDVRPSSNGAFKVKNSYGSTWMDQGGYFWLSYEDYYAGWYGWCVEKVTPAGTYESVYYHDALGASGNILGNEKIYGANVFKRKSSEPEVVTAVGVTVPSANATVSVYVNDGKNNFAPSALTTETFELPGYHTIILKKPVVVAQAEFTVGAIHSTALGTSSLLPYETKLDASQIVANLGESYYSKDGVNFKDASVGYGNMSINAMTSANPEDIYSVSLSHDELTLSVGQCAVLEATFKPQPESEDEITWSSSDDTVVSVDKGTLTAKGEGVATITVSANRMSASCVVTVRQMPEIKLSASSDKVGEPCTFTCTLSGDVSAEQISLCIFSRGRVMFTGIGDKLIYTPNEKCEYLAVAVCRTADGETLTDNLRFTAK